MSRITFDKSKEYASRKYKENEKGIHSGRLNYMFLDGDDKVIEDYRTGGAAPYFFILDKERIIRKVIRGYGMGKTDKEITEAIEELL